MVQKTPGILKISKPLVDEETYYRPDEGLETKYDVAGNRFEMVSDFSKYPFSLDSVAGYPMTGLGHRWESLNMVLEQNIHFAF